MQITSVKRKLTGAFKDRIALEIIGQIKAGNDTFGKLRKSMPNYDDRELKAGVRAAQNWLPMLERKGSISRPVMHKYQARLVKEGKRYTVITYNKRSD